MSYKSEKEKDFYDKFDSLEEFADMEEDNYVPEYEDVKSLLNSDDPYISDYLGVVEYDEEMEEVEE